MSEHEELQLPVDVAQIYFEYAAARSSASRWKAHEQALRDELLVALGYDPKDPKPAPVRGIAPSGEPLFEVAVSFRKGVDTAYLKKAHPDVYAECERSTPVKTIRAVNDAE